MKLIKLVLIVFASTLIFPSLTFAQSPTPSKEATTTASPKDISSFELFWPLAAGRTKADSVYTLKLIKENVRGLLIFGNVQKADYAVFLATKRLLEVEKLLSEGKQDLASKTGEAAVKQLAKAEKKLAKANEKNEKFNDNRKVMLDRLTNMQKFLSILQTKEGANLEQWHSIENQGKENLPMRQ